jgi:membrane-bound hydrogenase subunit mbhJ
MIYPGFWRSLRRGPATTAYPFAPDPGVPAPQEAPIATGPRGADPAGRGPLAYSLAIRHLDAGSCNGCESEIAMLASCAYDLSRLGFTFTPSPRHADLLLVTGVITEAMVPFVRQTYETMPAPKRVVVAGACALGQSPFVGMPGVRGSLDGVVPVDVRVPGCPPTPRAILDGILQAVGRAAPAAMAGRR